MTRTNVKDVDSSQKKSIYNQIYFDLDSMKQNPPVIEQQKVQLPIDVSRNVNLFWELLSKVYPNHRPNPTEGHSFSISDNEFWSTPALKKAELLTFAKGNYITYHDQPIIKGHVVHKQSPIPTLSTLLSTLQIPHQFDAQGQLLINHNHLQLLKSSPAYLNSHVALPPIATAQVNIYPSFILYLNHLFPKLDIHDAAIYKANKHIRKNHPLDEFCTLRRLFYINNGFLSQQVEQELQPQFNLSRHSLKIIYQLPQNLVQQFNATHPKPLNPTSDNTYTITHTLRNTPYDDINNIYNDMRLSLFQRFGQENVTILSTQCYYTYRSSETYHTTRDIFSHIKYHQSLNRLPDYCTLSPDKQHLTIQFDWNTHSLIDIINQLRHDFPYIDFVCYTNPPYTFNLCYYIQDLINYTRNANLNLHFTYNPSLNHYDFYHEFNDFTSFKLIGDRLIRFATQFNYNTDHYQLQLLNANSSPLQLHFQFNQSTFIADQKIHLANHHSTLCRINGEAIGLLTDSSHYPLITLQIFENKTHYLQTLLTQHTLTHLTLDPITK